MRTCEIIENSVRLNWRMLWCCLIYAATQVVSQGGTIWLDRRTFGGGSFDRLQYRRRVRAHRSLITFASSTWRSVRLARSTTSFAGRSPLDTAATLPENFRSKPMKPQKSSPAYCDHFAHANDLFVLTPHTSSLKPYIPVRLAHELRPAFDPHACRGRTAASRSAGSAAGGASCPPAAASGRPFACCTRCKPARSCPRSRHPLATAARRGRSTVLRSPAAAAILAGVMVPLEDIAAAEANRGARQPVVAGQRDHLRHPQPLANRLNERLVARGASADQSAQV